jgi:hypothetical protein
MGNSSYLTDGRETEETFWSKTDKIIAELSFFNDTSSVDSVTALPHNKDGTWLFAGNSRKPTYPILQCNTTTKAASVPTATTTSMPTMHYRSSPALERDEIHGYLISGIGRTPEGDGILHPGNGILR